MRRTWILCMVLLVAATGCRRKTPKTAAPPAPVVAAPPLELPPPPKPEPRVIEEPPLPPPPLPAPPEQEPTVITPNVIKLPPPPKPARKRGNGRAQTPRPKPAETSKPLDTPQPAPAEPAATPAPPQQQPAPVLEEVIPGDETKRLKQSLIEFQGSARRSLEALKGRRLTREQNETASRVRAFLRQSAETESRDISAAAELARRAALLAEDLRKSIE